MSDININIKVPAAEKLIDVVASGIGAVAGLYYYLIKLRCRRKLT